MINDFNFRYMRDQPKMLTSVKWKERVFVLTPKTLNYFEGSAEVRICKYLKMM